MSRIVAWVLGLSLATLIGCSVWLAWFRDPPARTVVVHVTDARGLPVSRFAWIAWNDERDERSILDLFRPRFVLAATGAGETVHADGVVHVFLQHERIVLEVRAKGHGSARLGPLVARSAPDRMTLVLPDLVTLSGTVTHEGRGLAGAEVEAEITARDPTAQELFGEDGDLQDLSTLTDDDGRFRLAVDPALGPYILTARAAGFTQARSGPVPAASTLVSLELMTSGSAADEPRTGGRELRGEEDRVGMPR